jgi:hypothetical protein
MTTARDARTARALSAIAFGDGRPLVPEDAQGQGATVVVAAALKRLADMKRPPARVIHHHAPDGGEPEAGETQ